MEIGEIAGVEVARPATLEHMKRTSHSKCECFMGCPLMGYFKYIASEEPEPKMKDYAFIGSYTHISIEKFFEKYAQEGFCDINELIYPQEHFTHTMNEIYRENSDKIIDANDDEAIVLCLNNFIDFMVRRWLYLTKLNMLDCFLPIAVEAEYEKIINGVPLHGFLDATFKDVKVWRFDWKTNKDTSKISPEYIKQGTRYVLLTEDEPEFQRGDMDMNDEFFIINLRKTVDLSKARVIITPEMKKEQEIELRQAWDLMSGTHFPKTSGKCNFFCEYKMLCKKYPKEGVTLVKRTIVDAEFTEVTEITTSPEDVSEYVNEEVNESSCDAWL